MGCSASKNKALDEPASGPAKPPKAEATEKPRPLMFAVMRNAHEVLRGLARDCQDSLDSEDLERFKKTYANFQKFSEVHASMEDGIEGVSKGFFAVLNEKFDNLAEKEGLFAQHDVLHKEVEKMNHAVSAETSITEVKSAFDSFWTVNDAHMKKEESVMMPKVTEMKNSGVNLKEIMNSDILPCAKAGDFEFWVTTAMQILEKHNEGKPRARVFAHALWGLASKEEWLVWEPWVKAGLSSKAYAEMTPLFVRDQ